MINQKDIFKNSISLDDIHKYFLLNQSLINKNTVLFNQNEEASGLFVILSGSVCISKIFHKEKIQKTAVSGDIIGIESFAGEMNYSATATVNEDAVISFFSKKEITVLIKKHPIVYCKLLIKLFGYLLTLENRLSVVSLKTVDENLKEVLAEINHESYSGHNFTMPDKTVNKKDKTQLQKTIPHREKINYFQLKIKQLIC